MEFMESKSAQNVKKALQDEALAVINYLLTARKAHNEGREDIAALYERMAQNEIEHAHIWYKHLYGELKDLKSCLREAAKIENTQWKDAYPSYAKIAKEENLNELAETFKRVAAIENAHERDFTEAYLRFDEAKVAEPVIKVEKAKYVCFLCGASSDESKDICEICGVENPFIQV